MSESADLKKTPLHALHVSLGARMVPFAGYDMPVQYAAGVMKEHLHTRTSAGLFDVSHMGQAVVKTNSDWAAIALALEAVLPVECEEVHQKPWPNPRKVLRLMRSNATAQRYTDPASA